MSNLQRLLGKGLVWITDSVVDHTINISKYTPLSGSIYIKLLKELDRSKKVLLIFKTLMIKLMILIMIFTFYRLYSTKF